MTDTQNATQTIFGEYKLLKRLGVGGAASVYLAERRGARGFTKRLALKRTHEQYQSQQKFVDQFVSEARLGGFLNHSNIVEVYEFGEVDGRAFMAMEYVNGPSLEWLIQRCRENEIPIPESIVLDIALPACEALAYAHGAQNHDGEPLQIVHRDVKPSNLLLSVYGEVKLADFGVARASSNVVQTTSAGIIKGTVRYMSPEQTSGTLEIDVRTDLYALALIIYELLAGQSMYQGSDQIGLFAQAMRGNTRESVEELPELGCHRAWVPLLNQVLENRPQDRPSSAKEMLRALRQIQRLIPNQGDLATFIAQMGYEEAFFQSSPIAAISSSQADELSLDNLSLASVSGSERIREDLSNSGRVSVGEGERRLHSVTDPDPMGIPKAGTDTFGGAEPTGQKVETLRVPGRLVRLKSASRYLWLLLPLGLGLGVLVAMHLGSEAQRIPPLTENSSPRAVPSVSAQHALTMGVVDAQNQGITEMAAGNEGPRDGSPQRSASVPVAPAQTVESPPTPESTRPEERVGKSSTSVAEPSDLDVAALIPGRLTLNSRPTTQAYIDGRRMGDIPLKSLRLAPGSHVVELRYGGKVVMRKSIEIGSQERQTCFADIKADRWVCR